MTWYYWLAIYIVGWVLTAAWLHAPENDDDYNDIAKSEFIALFWPIVIPLVLFGCVIIGISKLIRRILE